MASKKIEEGQEHIRLAEKCMKTGLLKWRPDYEIAVDHYQQAATCFRNAKQLDMCKESLMKAADCHKQNRGLFHAARCYEQIILILKEQNNLLQIEDLGHRACQLYQQQGSPEAAASALDKAAKIIETTLPESALNLYQHAVEVVMTEDSTRQAAEYACKISRILVRLQLYDQAADALRREICLNQQAENIQAIGRLAVALVLVQLARGDSVAAEKAFKEWGNCCDANEVQTLEMLLQAFDDEDPTAAKRALSSPFIKHMDVEYARLARDLPLPQGLSTAPKANVIENAAPSYKSPHTTSGDNADDLPKERGSAPLDDIEDGGLC